MTAVSVITAKAVEVYAITVALPGCLTCGKPTKRFVSSGRFARFCSDGCCQKYQRKATYVPRPLPAFVGPLRPKKRSTRVAAGTCAQCQQSFVRRVGHGRSKGARNDAYCGKRCQLAALAIARRGRRPVVSQAVIQRRIAARAKRAARAHARSIAVLLRANEALYSMRFGSCAVCSTLFFRDVPRQRTCRGECAEVRQQRMTDRAEGQRRAHKSLYRAKRRRRETDERSVAVDPYFVFTRDKWTCQICATRTPRRLRGTTDERAPELDHVVPLAAGGPHTYENTQCACRNCNSKKGARPLGQLGLQLGVVAPKRCGGGSRFESRLFPERESSLPWVFFPAEFSAQALVSAQKPRIRKTQRSTHQ